MDAETLTEAMPGLSLGRARDEVGAADQALLRADCTTVNRAAMFLAQVGHESMSLRYTEEIADGSAYEWRADLGNTQPGDGRRFKGRSYMQVTGRHNYGLLSEWAHDRGYVPEDDYFIRNPESLASGEYRWLGPVWYWITRRLNGRADVADVRGATRIINGGYNGLEDRTDRWQRCRNLGRRILPEVRTVPAHPTAGAIHTPFGQWGPHWSWNWNGRDGQHGGDDWHDGPASEGNPIYAIADGRVIHHGYARGESPGWGPAFGDHVLIEWDGYSDGGVKRVSIDAHMTRNTVVYNQRVKPGDIIGYLGATGNVTGPHDHHEQHAGQGWGDLRLKPVYPGRPITEEDDMLERFRSRNTKDQDHNKVNTWHRLRVGREGGQNVIEGPCLITAGVIHVVADGVGPGEDLLIRPYTVKTNDDGKATRANTGDDQLRFPGHEGWIRDSKPFNWLLGDGRALRFEWCSSSPTAVIKTVDISGTYQEK